MKTIVKTIKNNSGIKVNVGVKAGGWNMNHNRLALKVRTSIKAGEGILQANHNRAIR